MDVVFLTPDGALIALSVLLPLAALAVVTRRAGRIREALRLPVRSRAHLVAPAVAAACAAGLVGLAAAQPVLEETTSRRVRTDAEVFIVLDVTRSMLARANPHAPSRLARAKASARRLRASLGGVPVGVASLTDRVLPHLFPSADEDVFDATVQRAIDIERPPPRSSFLTNATSLDALASIASQRFFSPTAKRRLLVVFTDGESQSVNAARIARLYRFPPAIETLFVHVWGASERVYSRGVPEPQYRPDPEARSHLDALAAATGGAVYDEGDRAAAGRSAREVLGGGPTIAKGLRRDRTALAPYLAAVAILPLAFFLRRRDR